MDSMSRLLVGSSWSRQKTVSEFLTDGTAAGWAALTKISTSGCRQDSSANTTRAFCPPTTEKPANQLPSSTVWLILGCRSYPIVWRSEWCGRGSPGRNDRGISCRPDRAGWSSSSGTLWLSPPCWAGQHTAGWRSPLSERITTWRMRKRGSFRKPSTLL